MTRRLTAKFFVDLALWTAAIPLAFIVRLEARVWDFFPQLLLLTAIATPLQAITAYGFGLYRCSWHRLSIRDLTTLLAAVGTTTAILLIGSFVLPSEVAPPRSAPIIAGMIAILLMGATRLGTRLYYEQSGYLAVARREKARRVLVVGAGEAGIMIAREMLRHRRSGRIPIGFLDDDPIKRRQRFLGLRVLGSVDDLIDIVNSHIVDEVLIAIPSATGDAIRRIVDLARKARIEYRIIPGFYELLNGHLSTSQIREVQVEDLLRRQPVRLEMEHIAGYIRDRVVLVTGAGGSIGSEIVRQVARFEPKSVILLGRGENSIYLLEQELRRTHPLLHRQAVICDVRDRDSLANVFDRFKPTVVFHAAAHKHVPLMEANPEQAILNNVVGTRNVVELALKYDVKRLVNVSTDKAVNPTSVMGASKRVAEMIVSTASQRCRPGQAFVSVRFGNVLGSRGSVIPIFQEQIRNGGPITITHPEMTRFFMTIPEASQLVLQAGSMAENGNVYVLDMGEPVRIVDLARDLIQLSGLRLEDIDIVFTGVRPGEKLYEEILTAEEGTVASRHEKIFVARNGAINDPIFEARLDQLVEASSTCDESEIRRLLAEMIPSHQFEAVADKAEAA